MIGAILAGLAVSLAPNLALLGAAALLINFRNQATERLWQMLNETAALEALRSQGAWQPGRNLCRLFVWSLAVTFLALGAFGLLHS
jgi:hypothetical protein